MPGFACDLTVLGVDPTTCDPAELLTDTVRLTVINGVVAWRAPEKKASERGG